jgi:hypothetical protein
VEETRALQLRFSKEDVIGKKKHVGKSWTNISFLWKTNIGNTIVSHLRKAIGKDSKML